MWKDYAKSIDTTYTNLTKQQKIQAEVNGILEETKFQMGDAEEASGTFMGQTAKLSASFTNLKVAIGNTIIPALQRIIPVIDSVLQKLTTFFSKMALYSELLFGIKKANDTSTSSTNKSVSATEGLADAQTDVADATAEANKEMQANLAGMDELNILASESSDSIGDTVNTDGLNLGGLDAEVAVKDGIDPKIAIKIEELKGKIEKLITSAKDKFKELWGIIEPFRTFVAEGAKDFYNSFLKPLANWTIGEGLPKLQEVLEKFMKNTNWSKLNKSLENFWKSLEPFAENVGGGLLWLLDNVLRPLAEWTISDLIPAFLDTLSSALGVLDSVVKNASTAFGRFYDNAILPLAGVISDVLIKALEYLYEMFEGISGWINANPELFGNIVIGIGSFVSGILGAIGAIKGIVEVGGVLKTLFSALPAVISLVTSPIGLIVLAIGAVVAGMALLVNRSEDGKNAVFGFFDSIKDIVVTLWNEFLKPIFDNIAEQVSWLWENHLKPLGTKLLDFLQSFLEFWNAVIAPVLEKAISLVSDKLVKAINFAIDVASTAIATVVDVIGGIIDSLKGVLDFITGIFTGDAEKAFEGLGKIFTGLGDAMMGVLKGVINFFIDVLNGIASVILKPLADIFDPLFEKIDDIPGIDFGFRFSGMEGAKIPKLATGTVVPANYGEFVATLGDNTREPEIVSPLSTMKQALYEALQDADISGGGSITIPVYIGNEMLDKYVITAEQRRNAKTNGWRG